MNETKVNSLKRKGFRVKQMCDKRHKELSDKKMHKINRNYVNNSLLSDSKLHQLLPNIHPTTGYKKIVENNNLKVFVGKFNKNERNILTNNWNKFCDEFKCDEDMKIRLLGFFRYSDKYTKEERKQFKKFNKTENFILRLAKDLPNRMIPHIYLTARNMFCPLKRLRELSETDKQSVKTLYFNTSLKGKWTQIAEKVNCNPRDVEPEIKQNYNCEGQPYNRGKWSLTEDKQILNAFKSVLKTDDLTQHIFTKNIPYIKIRDLSEINRSHFSCKERWKKVLRWKVANFDQFEDKWSKSDSSKLIYCLFKSNFENECHIDWDFIKEKFSNISSFNNLMKNWRIIKSTVPDFHNKTYKQIIEYLFDNFLPNFIKTDDDLKELENFYQN